MRSTFIACVLTAAAGMGAQAQLASPGRNETAQRLSAAVAARQGEQARTGEQEASRAVLAGAAADARIELAKPVGAEEAARDAAAQKRMGEALQGLSPEGKLLLAQNEAPLLKVPVAAGP
ncbi:MAG: hypothetical protein JWO94_2852, partial [Verrucomicrobiaceae bacterium]|nr:hypothetical protein [Verrucomicrobiaceae bacterium]